MTTGDFNPQGEAPAVGGESPPMGAQPQAIAPGANPPDSAILPLPVDEGPKIVATPDGGEDGVNRCVKCGASDVVYNAATAMFMCGFCRHQWRVEGIDAAMGLSHGIDQLAGTTMSTAAVDIEDDAALVTLHCDGCGSDVVIDTDHNLRARCHWCKHELSLNNRVPNGAVPDGILPFSVTKEEAMASIKAFVEERKSFAKAEFSTAFKPENVMGVYLPHMTVDGNIAARLDGVGEILEERIKVGDNQTRYRIRRFSLMRTFKVAIDDVVVSSSFDKANIRSEISTNNIINAILPFDVKNIVRFNSNFLGDVYTSERRDMDIAEAESYAGDHFLTIARASAASTVTGYDRGVRWESEQVQIVGSRWTSVLLPVWLYGFVDKTKDGPVTHYIAVNGRSRATMGSVPINTGKAALVSWSVAIGISIITWPIAIAVFLSGG
ncbi:MAG: TFIIB-type zinc ribbon-containing protein [Demequinaceae bacterium]|nr:TFIIB-type zinc ribbon-containing protein [Demequinaceae bacterium]